MDGFLVVDKPAGITSHDVVAIVRRATGMKKVGHTGTLDPFATGVLPIAVGEATKAIPFLDESVKEYRGVMKLGETTDTGDCTGKVVRSGPWQRLEVAEVMAAAMSMIGDISQIPPMFSAVKKGGVPLYKIARRGETVEREPRQVTIHDLTIDRAALPEIAFTVRCSRGTYVRTLAEDLGGRLGCGGHLLQLRRTLSGPFPIEKAISVDDLFRLASAGRLAGTMLPVFQALSHLQDIPLSVQEAAKVACGVAPEAGGTGGEEMTYPPGERVRLSSGGKLVAVAEMDGGRTPAGNQSMRLLRVFN